MEPYEAPGSLVGGSRVLKTLGLLSTPNGSVKPGSGLVLVYWQPHSRVQGFGFDFKSLVGGFEGPEGCIGLLMSRAMAQLVSGQDLLYILVSVSMGETSLEAYVDFLVEGLVSAYCEWSCVLGCI